MNGMTLAALRGILMFSVPEAAELVAGVAERTWRRWEDGSRSVPDDVADRVHELAAWRAQRVVWLESQLKLTAAPLALRYFPTLADWTATKFGEPVYWRPACSAAAEVASRYPDRVVLDTDQGI